MVRSVNKGKTCLVEDCNTPARVKEMCRKHWQRWTRHGDPTYVPSPEEISEHRRAGRQRYLSEKGAYVTPVAKECKRCGVLKAADQFYIQRQNGNEYLYPCCIPCHAIVRRERYEKVRAAREAEKAAREANRPNGGICVAIDCDSKQWYQQDVCKYHYGIRWKTGDENTPRRRLKKSEIVGDDTIRLCTTCERIKDAEQFYLRGNGTRQSQCKTCMSACNGIRQYLQKYDDVPGALAKVSEYTGNLHEKTMALVVKYQKERGTS